MSKIFFLTLIAGFSHALFAQSADSLWNKAQIEATNNHFAEANKIMKSLVSTYPANTDYAIFYGSLCSWMHNYDSSKAILKRVILREPKNLDAYDALTDAEMWSGNDSLAIVDCKKAMLMPGADRKFYILKIAEAEKDIQNFQGALYIVDSVLVKYPKDSTATSLKEDIYAEALQKTADSLFDTAQQLSYRKEYNQAEKIVRKLLIKFPNNTDYKTFQGRLFANGNKIDSSEIVLKKVLTENPEDLEAYEALINDEILDSKFKYALALSDTAIALPVKGDRTSLLIAKANAQNNLEDYNGALKTLDTLVKKHPDNEEALELYKTIRVQILQKRADSLFAMAQKDAEKKNYSKAQVNADTITRWFPDNSDYLIFKGRNYCWQKNDSGIAIIQGIISKDPHNLDAYDALTDIEMDKKKYVTVITDCNKVLQDSTFRNKSSLLSEKNNKKSTKDTNARNYYCTFMLKKAHAFFNMERYDACKKILDTVCKIDPTNHDANDLFTKAKIKGAKNVIETGYLNNSFSNPSNDGPWHYTWLGFMHNFYHCPVYAKLTYASLYGLPMSPRMGLQYEIGAYPKFNATMNGDAEITFSNNYFAFPKWQITANLFQALPHGFEASVGGMYMYFLDVVDDPPTPPQNVWIFDPYLGYYIGDDYQFSYRPYFAFKGSKTFLTHTITLRRFIGNEDNWISLYGAIGSSPFVDYYFPSPIPTKLRLVGADFQVRLPHNWLIWPMFDYEYEEYYPETNLWRNMFYVQVILTKRF